MEKLPPAAVAPPAAAVPGFAFANALALLQPLFQRFRRSRFIRSSSCQQPLCRQPLFWQQAFEQPWHLLQMWLAYWLFVNQYHFGAGFLLNGCRASSFVLVAAGGLVLLGSRSTFVGWRWRSNSLLFRLFGLIGILTGIGWWHLTNNRLGIASTHATRTIFHFTVSIDQIADFATPDALQNLWC